jgi:putative membrane protein
MKFFFKFAVKIALNGLVLYILNKYLAGFTVYGDYGSLLIGGAVLAFISIVIRPIVRLVTAPIVWLTLGLFNLVINAGLLFIADLILPQLEITGFGTLFIASIIIALANSFF